jgi:hypothetical protein
MRLSRTIFMNLPFPTNCDDYKQFCTTSYDDDIQVPTDICLQLTIYDPLESDTFL